MGRNNSPIGQTAKRPNGQTAKRPTGTLGPPPAKSTGTLPPSQEPVYGAYPRCGKSSTLVGLQVWHSHCLAFLSHCDARLEIAWHCQAISRQRQETPEHPRATVQ